MADWLAVVIALVAVVVSYLLGRRANGKADTANVTAVEGNQIAVDANTTAEKANAIAEQANRIATEAAADAHRLSTLEHNREHEILRPIPPAAIDCEMVDGHGGRDTLFGEITVPRDYRVTPTALQGNSRVNLGLPLVLHANQPQRFQIEQWADGQTEPRTQFIQFQFWPPVAEVDPVDAWSCACGRDDQQGHWMWRVPVKYSNPIPPSVF